MARYLFLLAAALATADACTPSDLAQYTCMEVVDSAVTKYWYTGTADQHNRAVQITASGWAAISFPTTAGRMATANAFINEGGTWSRYLVSGYSTSSITENSWVDSDALSLQGTAQGTVSFIEWKGTGVQDVNYAYHTSVTTLTSKHTTRGSTTVGTISTPDPTPSPPTPSPTQTSTETPTPGVPSTPTPTVQTPAPTTASPASSPEETCVTSTLPGYSCMKSITSIITVHWDSATKGIAVAFKTNGWAAVGFPETRGRMGPSKAAIASSEGLRRYTIGGGNSLSSLQLASGLLGGVVDTVAYEVVGDLKVLQWVGGGMAEFTYSCHTTSSSLTYHSVRGSVVLDVASGGVEVTAGEGNKNKARTHGLVMIILWGLLAPWAIMMKRFGPLGGLNTWTVGKYPLHFVVHGAMLVVVVACTALMVGLALRDFGGTVRAHKPIAIVIVSIAAAQVVMNLVRPANGAPLRKYFNIPHRALGMTVYVLSIAQVFTGIHNYEERYQDSEYARVLKGTAASFIAVSVIAFFSLSVVGRKQAKKNKISECDSEPDTKHAK